MVSLSWTRMTDLIVLVVGQYHIAGSERKVWRNKELLIQRIEHGQLRIVFVEN